MNSLKRLQFLTLLVTFCCASVTPVRADTSSPVRVTIDGRAVSRTTAYLRNGVVYVELVGIVRAFNGLVVFDGPTSTVSIGNRVAIFTLGSSRANLDGQVVATGGKTSESSGDRFIPMTFFVTRVARSSVRVAANGTVAAITSLTPPPSISPTAAP